MTKPKKDNKGLYCFICGTIDIENDDKKVGIFETTNKRLMEWERVIPKAGLQLGSRICDRHFDPADVIKGREIGGRFYEFKKWTLTDSAIPKHFPGWESQPPRRTSKIAKPVQSVVVNRYFRPIKAASPKKTLNSSQPEVNAQPEPATSSPSAHPATLPQQDNTTSRQSDEFHQDNPIRPSTSKSILARTVTLPKGWMCNRSSQSFFKIPNEDTVSNKIVKISGDRVTFFVSQKKVSHPFIMAKNWTLSELERAIQDFDERNVCPGILDLSSYSASKKSVNLTGNLHSPDCLSICEEDETQCRCCRREEAKLKQFKQAQSEKVTSLQKRLKVAQRRIVRFQHYKSNICNLLVDVRQNIRAIANKPLYTKMKPFPQPAVKKGSPQKQPPHQEDKPDEEPEEVVEMIVCETVID